ncbi:glycosyltransferase [Mucilaginibacter sp. HMF7410]|uniref:Glycosyltransferase n=2 Tax=Mucilaginibacter arboris TaxID=2682090 RepID=A0A7K1SRQ7_9SPHI|nr:glycosyltransferase [Mucilaginibacter arboris]
MLFTAFYVILFVFLIAGWLRVKQSFLPVKEAFQTKVTVLIAARNEEAGIHQTIEDILAQQYPKELLEVIIADDHSTDRTAEIILSYAGRGVKLLQLKEDQPLNSYKKKAISEAIKLSKGDLMVATDADCRMGPHWLEAIVSKFEKSNVLMLSSPVAFFEDKNLFERLQALEFSAFIGLGASTIGNKKASTCNGANLAYKKSIFNEVGGFKGIDDLASGDDELLLQKIAAKYPDGISFLKQKEAIVYTYAKSTWEEFKQQRRRWASKSVKYKDKAIVALAVGFWFFNALILANLAAGIFNVFYLKVAAVQLLLKIISEGIFLFFVTTFFKRRKLLLLLPLGSLLHVFYVVYIGIIGNKGVYEWKGRKVH